jgi:hypothetical protein
MVDVQALPPIVRRYVEQAVPTNASGAVRVCIVQVGEMWQKPGGRALSFSATEELSVTEIAFSWRARFALVPLVSLRVVDEYRNAEGRLEVRTLGAPIVRKRGPELNVGEAMRYLAEIPFAPQAILRNDGLEWRVLDATTVEVATHAAATRVSVRLRFDESGLVTRSFSPARPRLDDGNRPTPWSGRFSAYATLGGVLVPTRAEACWELPGGAFTYWRGTITSLETR